MPEFIVTSIERPDGKWIKVDPNTWDRFKPDTNNFAIGGFASIVWKPVDDRHPKDCQLVAAKCADGSIFYGFCIYPYSDCGSIKNWYEQTTKTDWHRVYKKIVEYQEIYTEEEMCELSKNRSV